MSKDPTIGVATSGTIIDEVIFEMLEHQGIFFERVGSTHGRKSYPVVLVARADVDSLANARKICTTHSGVIAVGKVLDLPRAIRCLAGLEDSREDRLGCAVNELETKLVDSIVAAFSETGSNLVRKSFWPGNAPACCVITGDVDWLTYSPFHKSVVKGTRSPGKFANLILGSVSGKNFGLNFDSMVRVPSKYNFKSTVFFKSSYDEGMEYLQSSLKLLRDSGFEIGLHGSDGAHTSLASLSSQIKVITSWAGAKPKGVRHHILKMNVPETWELESEAGLDYDATFSYNRYFGFRGEVCFPYHPFGKSRLPLLELPTSFMDWTAMKRGLRGESAERILNQIMGQVERYHGLLMVNFHNTYLNSETFPDILKLYEDLIERVHERGYWVATASECANWWRTRAATGPESALGSGDQQAKAGIPLEDLGVGVRPRGE